MKFAGEITDPVSLYSFSEIERDIVDTAVFQRLRGSDNLQAHTWYILVHNILDSNTQLAPCMWLDTPAKLFLPKDILMTKTRFSSYV